MNWDQTSHEERIEFLRETPLFRRLAHGELSHLAFEANRGTAEPGTPLTRIGERGRYLYFIESGTVSISWHDQQEPVLLPARTGAMVGWSALVEPFTYTANTIAVDTCDLQRIGAGALLRIFDQRQDVGYEVMTAVAAIARERFSAAVDQLSASWTRAALIP